MYNLFTKVDGGTFEPKAISYNTKLWRMS